LAQDPEKQRRMLDLAASNTDRLIRLINDILDVERINAGGITFERSAANVRELVESSVEALRPIAERAGVMLRWECDEMRLWADPDRMIQTLTNLIGNAIKFSPVGSAVEVSARRDEPYALFAVRDHGRGIPPEKIATIFDRFQQVDASDSRKKGGTGLGLTISRGIIQQHGGRIWAESIDGDGSVFQFTVPLFTDDVTPPSDLPRRAVLICDDDDDLVEVLCATLAARAFTAVGAHSGGEAIARFDASPSEVVIVDLLLPDIHGREVIRHIHSTSPHTRIIVYTAAYVDDADRDAISAAGARTITKGKMTLDQLADEVALLLAQSEQTQPQTVA
jgi:CheY-like chemotaxis protein